MTKKEFKELVRKLTGTPVKQDNDDQLLTGLLRKRSRRLDLSQFNELLLLVNKDRVEQPFFDRFFGPNCTVGTLPEGVEQFQTLAMLRYGNFIFAYRKLSKIRDRDDFDREIGDVLNEPTEQIADFQKRGDPLLSIKEIPREDTPLVGYLAPKQLLADDDDGRFLLSCIASLRNPTWADFESKLNRLSRGKPEQSQRAALLVKKYRKTHPSAGPDGCYSDLFDLVRRIHERAEEVRVVQALATRNQDVYLTWDHMDVYFATSMRKAWEFADLYDFINKVVKSNDLADLNLRYFDPTQCFTKSRIDKGLVESLMLKRAKCTVYSVQDTDTLGKDSELAATLAQGKPVIAYVPETNSADRARELLDESPATILDRLRFVMHADERFTTEVSPDDLDFVRDFKALTQFVSDSPFRSMQDERAVAELRSACGAELARLCQLIAESEKRIYDGRANTLQNAHPLGIQVNLDTGVANGVLVVRSAEDCASLLRAILTRSMVCFPEYDPEENIWHLREQISGSIFRVVTGNKKINNCFWNFYLRNETTGRPQ